jgi:hypothetical protein
MMVGAKEGRWGFPGGQLAAEDNGFEFDTDTKADSSSSLTAVVCVLVSSDSAKNGLAPHGENPQSFAPRRQEVA